MNMSNITFWVLRLSTFVFNKMCSEIIIFTIIFVAESLKGIGWNNVGQHRRQWSSFTSALGMYRVFVCFWRILTLPLPISHLCENYLPLPNSHLCELHMCTCINCNGDISLHAWLKIANQNGHSHGRNALLFLILCDVRMRIAMTCMVPREYFRGSSLKQVGFWG